MTPRGRATLDRAVVLSGLFAITALSWGYMWYLARGAMEMCAVNVNPWSIADLIATLAMWAVMMAAMMVPSASPMILAFAGVNRQRRERALPYAATGFFLLGYLAVWTAFSAVATLMQAALHSAALLSPMMVSTSRILGGVLLIAAGVFQWTRLKYACLRHCRTPLGFLLTEWRDGAWGAFSMGLRHGSHCVGCCWLLMGLLFVAGVMSLWWVAAIAAFVLLEKLAPAGLLIARVSGVLLAAWGLWTLAG